MKFLTILFCAVILSTALARAQGTAFVGKVLSDQTLQNYALKNIPEGSGDMAYHFEKVQLIGVSSSTDQKGFQTDETQVKVTYRHNFEPRFCELDAVYIETSGAGQPTRGKVTAVKKICN